MIRILLIRHGATELLGRVLYGRLPEIHLSSEGVNQAETLAKALRQRYKLSEVISSPLERAVQTAQPIAKAQDLSISIEEGLNELDFGSWMGMPFSELHELDHWKRYNQRRSSVSPPGGESMQAVQVRAWTSLERISDRYRDSSERTVAVVTHGDVVRTLLVLLLGMPLDHISRLEVAPASVSEIVLGSDEPLVRTVNQCFC